MNTERQTKMPKSRPKFDLYQWAKEVNEEVVMPFAALALGLYLIYILYILFK